MGILGWWGGRCRLCSGLSDIQISCPHLPACTTPTLPLTLGQAFGVFMAFCICASTMVPSDRQEQGLKKRTKFGLVSAAQPSLLFPNSYHGLSIAMPFLGCSRHFPTAPCVPLIACHLFPKMEQDHADSLYHNPYLCLPKFSPHPFPHPHPTPYRDVWVSFCVFSLLCCPSVVMCALTHPRLWQRIHSHCVWCEPYFLTNIQAWCLWFLWMV